MPATNQWAVSTLIREVLADPDLAHDEVFRRLPPGRAARAWSRFGAAAVIGAQRHVAHPAAHQPPQRHEAQDRGHHRRRGGSRPSPSFAPARSSPPCSTPAGGSTRPRCAVICSARSRGGLHPQGLATSSRPWATSPGSAAPRSRGSATGIDEGVHEFLSRRLDHTWFPHLFAGRHPPGRARGAPGGLPGPGGGHRRVGRRPPGDPGTWPRGTPRRSTSGSSLSCGPCANGGSRSPRPTTPRAWSWTIGDAHAGIRAAVRAILPGASWQRCRAPLRPHHHHPGWARPAPEPAGALVSTIFAPTSRQAVIAQYQHVIDTLRDAFPFRIARMLIDAQPDLTAFAALPREHRAKIRPQQPHRAPWAARPGAAPTSPRVLPDSDSARPLIGPALPEQRGVAVRRTTPPLPGLTAPPDRHAPHRQQRRRRQSPRPAPHHHLTGRTPHQKT